MTTRKKNTDATIKMLEDSNNTKNRMFVFNCYTPWVVEIVF